MLLFTSGPNDCCWSFVLRLDTMTIIFVSSVMFACCELFFCHDDVENVAGTDVFWVLHLLTAVQKIFNYNIQILSFFVLPVNF